MTRPLLVACLLLGLATRVTGASSWSVTISPEGAHIRENKAVTIMCLTSPPSQKLNECTFKIDARPSLTYTAQNRSSVSVVLHEGKPVYTAKYAGRGLNKGQCGLRLSGVAAGVYVVGCRLKTRQGLMHQEFTTLTVDNSQPLKLQVNRKYQLVEPGSDVSVLCNTEKRQKINHCAFRLPSNKWVLFHQGHESRETSSYHYRGRGLEKGHCGVNLLNVTEADSGMVMCHVKVGDRHTVRAVALTVSQLEPALTISWDVKPAVEPGDILSAECIMKGAYPLPKMEWTFDGSALSSSDVRQDINATFTWPWENQVMRQEISTRVGHEFGKKHLKCSAASRHDCDAESPSKLKASNPANEIEVSVEPSESLDSVDLCRDCCPSAGLTGVRCCLECGLLTTACFNAPAQHGVAKRSVAASVSASAAASAGIGGAGLTVDSQEAVQQLDRNQQAVVPLTASRRTSRDVDYVEPVWDEEAEESQLLDSRPDYVEFETSFIMGAEEIFAPPVFLFAQEEGGQAVHNFTGAGTEDSFVAYPWTTGVYKLNNGTYTQLCGGTLVTATHVISAAHCFWNEPMSSAFAAADYKMALGKIYRKWSLGDEQVQRRGVAALHVHPAYRGRKRNLKHDIAVAVLDAAVEFTARVAPACLDLHQTGGEAAQLAEGQVGVVTGWGYTEDGTSSDVLRFVRLPYVDPDTCIDMLPEDMQQLLTTDKFCAGFRGRNISVCPGDSGGGLLFELRPFGAYFLRGVVSVSFRPPSFTGKCFSSEVTGFTLVSHSLPWLKRLLRVF